MKINKYFDEVRKKTVYEKKLAIAYVVANFFMQLGFGRIRIFRRVLT